MFAKIFIAFIVIPLFDFYLLVQIGTKIGTLNAIALCILTAFAGASLARSQGMATMQKVRENMDKGIMPAEDILDAVIIFLAGMVLLPPVSSQMHSDCCCSSRSHADISNAGSEYSSNT